MKLKFTIIDYIIIILVICAIVFAFIHITTDDSSDLQKTAFDESTISKIPDTYLKYYKDGLIVNATLEGYNSTNGEPVTLNGNVVWADDNAGDVELVIKTDNGTYLTGFYRYNSNYDIYIDHLSLEINGEKYKNLSEITIKAREITSLNDLISKISPDTNYEISTNVALDELTAKQLQEIKNLILEHDKRDSMKTGIDGQLIITKATKQNIIDADSLLGNIDGVTDKITIRIYDGTDEQINAIKNNYDVVNIKSF